MNGWWWFLVVWIACGIASYFLGMYRFHKKFPDWFNEQEKQKDRRFCAKMALAGPFSLIVLLFMLADG